MKNIMIIGLLALLAGHWIVEASQSASTSTPVLYSINLPANPFQQHSYQMMFKTDSANTVYDFTNTTPAPTNGILLLLTSFFTGVGVLQAGLRSYSYNVYANSDYVALYLDGYNTGEKALWANLINKPYVIYGMSPYRVRGYVEGAGQTLYFQRPAEVTLPYPTITNPSATPLLATFPDYTDIFQSWTAGNLLDGIPAFKKSTSSFITPFQNNKNAQLPAWYSAVPQLAFDNSPGDGFGSGDGACYIAFAPLNSFEYTAPLTKKSGVLPPAFQLYQFTTPSGWSYWPTFNNVSTHFMNPTALGQSPHAFIPYEGSSTGGFNGISPFVWGGIRLNIQWGIRIESWTNWTTCVRGWTTFMKGLTFGDNFFDSKENVFSFAPVIPPSCPFIQGVTTNDNLAPATGDLAGLYSSANVTFPNLKTYGNPNLTADENPIFGLNQQVASMNFFQLFAQNMQAFTYNTEIWSQSGWIYQDGASSRVGSPEWLNWSPGQGQFSDIMQISAMQADSPFVGSYGATSNTPNFTLADPRTNNKGALTKLSSANFKQAPYVCNYIGSSDSGGSEGCFEYYNGTIVGKNPSATTSPYLPLYISDPIPLDQPGFNYAVTLDDMQNYNGVVYNKKQARMTDFTPMLGGTRSK